MKTKDEWIAEEMRQKSAIDAPNARSSIVEQTMQEQQTQQQQPHQQQQVEDQQQHQHEQAPQQQQQPAEIIVVSTAINNGAVIDPSDLSYDLLPFFVAQQQRIRSEPVSSGRRFVRNPLGNMQRICSCLSDVECCRGCCIVPFKEAPCAWLTVSACVLVPLGIFVGLVVPYDEEWSRIVAALLAALCIAMMLTAGLMDPGLLLPARERLKKRRVASTAAVAPVAPNATATAVAESVVTQQHQRERQHEQPVDESPAAERATDETGDDEREEEEEEMEEEPDVDKSHAIHIGQGVGIVVLEPCRSCRITRPPRSSHGGASDVCFAHYDHSCGIIGASVAERNFRFFTFAVLSFPLYALFILARCIAVAVTETRNLSSGAVTVDAFSVTRLVFAYVFILIGCCVQMVWGVACHYVQMAGQGQTLKDIVGRQRFVPEEAEFTFARCWSRLCSWGTIPPTRLCLNMEYIEEDEEEEEEE